MWDSARLRCSVHSKLRAVAVFLSFVVLEGMASAQDDPHVLLQAGLYAEEVDGDLSAAMAAYRRVVENFPQQRMVAARAYLQIGLCYEKLGDEQNARKTYQKLLRTYPEQVAVVQPARDRLQRLRRKTSIHPLTVHYFQRFGIDLLTSTSYDEKFFSYTDWTTGSLMVRRLENPQSQISNSKLRTLNPNSEPRIGKADFARSHEYAYYPAFSWDGQTIAYSWYRAPYWVELRTVSLEDGTIKVVYSRPGLILHPHDWTPDGKTVVCETLDYDREVPKWLGLVDVATGNLQEPLPLWKHGRGLKVSPDGRYVVYDLDLGGRVNIYVFDLETQQQSVGLFSVSGYLAGWDAPVWSPDGALLLARNQGTFELWAQPVKNGKRNGLAYRIQADLPRAMLALKGIDHSADKERQPLTKTNNPDNDFSFNEEFDTPELDPAWSVFRWDGPNVYGYLSFGRISLTDRPGHLRYYLDPIMSTTVYGYHPQFSGWYWWYPALELRRPLYGTRWRLQTRVTYSLVDGANGRSFTLAIIFGQGENRSLLQLRRGKDIDPLRHGLHAGFLDRGIPVLGSEDFLSPADTSGLTPFTYVYRITRRDSLLAVEVSDDDGQHFQQIFFMTLRLGLREQPQSLILTGDAWFVPAGAYADWDYVRFRRLEPER